MKMINLITGKQGSGKTTFVREYTKGKLTACLDCSKYLAEDITTTMRVIPDVEAIIIDGATIKDSKMIYDLSMWLVAIGTKIDFYFVFQVTAKEMHVIFKEISFLVFDIDQLPIRYKG